MLKYLIIYDLTAYLCKQKTFYLEINLLSFRMQMQLYLLWGQSVDVVADIRRCWRQTQCGDVDDARDSRTARRD
jgi:hypothetical protein